jgi:hypothetical protein
VSYATSDLTAHAGSDYVTTTGTLTFPPGETFRFVPVTINDDTVHETNESFAVTLSSPTGATLGDPDGTEVIVDNDPIAPASPIVRAISTTSRAQLTWSAPANNGSAITSYEVRVYDNGVIQTSKSHMVTCTQPCTPATTWWVTGLANDKQYKFAVSAQNAKGSGPFGSTTILVADRGAVPGTLITPHATAGSGQVTLTWVEPPNGTATITSYTLTPIKNGVAQPAIVAGRTARSFVFTNVTAGATYTFIVTATSRVGFGHDSDRSNAVIPT